MDRLDDDGDDRSQPMAHGPVEDWSAVNPADSPTERSQRPASPRRNAQPARGSELWNQTFSKGNLLRALQRVESNRGAPGVDGMPVTELRPWLRLHWKEVRQALDAGTFRPSPVRRVTIPKPGGGERELGVPTALDRLIQQAIAQALTPIFDPEFSAHSYGFRPGRSAHQAVRAARAFVVEGYTWVVDVDLERFFDRVQHDALMARVARKVKDDRLLRLIRRYLDSGVMVEGVKQASVEGTPQGSPLSPLLANIMLDDLDRQLGQRGHRFVRYADDIRVHVKSERAGQRVLAGMTEFLQRRLKLRVNKAKSSVRHAAQALVLGFGFYFRRTGEVAIRVAPKALGRMRGQVRVLTGRNWRITMPERIARLNRFVAGWCAYFALAETPSTFEEADEWLRRRLRQVRWKEWKRPRARFRNLLTLGIPRQKAYEWANSSVGHWRMARSAPLQRALPIEHWNHLGLTGFKPSWRRLRSTW
ncbi:MAG TPA: group II intron reverse transcriptase/maturase [Acidimicrobiales bacterium]|nr:group II intron reverse transcriptase/maturase [Acidimicrobiales bacterium]